MDGRTRTRLSVIFAILFFMVATSTLVERADPLVAETNHTRGANMLISLPDWALTGVYAHSQRNPSESKTMKPTSTSLVFDGEANMERMYICEWWVSRVSTRSATWNSSDMMSKAQKYWCALNHDVQVVQALLSKRNHRTATPANSF